ncbi:MAG: hypothetical protein ACYC2E_17265 [Sulfuricella sp.]
MVALPGHQYRNAPALAARTWQGQQANVEMLGAILQRLIMDEVEEGLDVEETWNGWRLVNGN